MRNMSFALTTEQIRSGSKTVTRRTGWLNLHRGDLLRAVVKCQGLNAEGESKRVSDNAAEAAKALRYYLTSRSVNDHNHIDGVDPAVLRRAVEALNAHAKQTVEVTDAMVEAAAKAYIGGGPFHRSYLRAALEAALNAESESKEEQG